MKIPFSIFDRKSYTMTAGEKNRVGETFVQGSSTFSRDDLEGVMKDEKRATEKASSLGDQFENFKLLWQLLKDYWNGQYPNAPWKLVAAIGFAVLYLISPLDIIPDFIPVAGFIDDGTVFALVINQFQSEIDAYKEWKAAQEKQLPPAE